MSLEIIKSINQFHHSITQLNSSGSLWVELGFTTNNSYYNLRSIKVLSYKYTSKQLRNNKTVQFYKLCGQVVQPKEKTTESSLNNTNEIIPRTRKKEQILSFSYVHSVAAKSEDTVRSELNQEHSEDVGWSEEGATTLSLTSS